MTIRKLIDQSKDKDWVICSIGIGCPGWAKNGVLVRASNLPLVKNFNFTAALKSEYPEAHVLLLNDADAAVSAEVWGKDSKDHYKNFTNIAMITLGTGVGCGLILNEQLHLGSNGLIEAGHMIVSTDPDCRKCSCGQTGCVETIASAFTTARRLREADVAAGKAVSEEGVDGSKEVLTRYHQGDAAAVKVLQEVSSLYLCMYVYVLKCLFGCFVVLLLIYDNNMYLIMYLPTVYICTYVLLLHTDCRAPSCAVH